MADFRKWLFAFALVALLLGAFTASAQPGVGTEQSAFTCVANAGTPVIVRYEGITELVGDLLLQCTGGQPTPAGSQIPAQNVTLTLNTNVTSRLIGSGFIDALLLIDDPYPSPGNFLASPPVQPNPAVDNPSNVTIPANSPTQGAFGAGAVANNLVCEASTSPVSGQCNYITGTFDGTHSTAYGSPYSPYVGRSVSTIYAGRPTSISGTISGNQVTWLGVPIDAPGTVGVRVVRLTNVRANACQLGLSSTLIPTQIVGFVSITGSQFVTINNPQQTLAYIQQGLFVSGGNTNLQQCTNLNVGGGGVGGNFFGNGNNGIAVTSINLREGFAQSFKRRNYELGTSTTFTGSSGTPFTETGVTALYQNERPQNLPGTAYNTESAFEPSTDGTTFNGPWGRADAGTRFLIRFNNLGAGAQLLLPVYVPLTTGGSGGCGAGNTTPPSAIFGGGACANSGTDANGFWTGGYLMLIGTSDLNGNVGTFGNQFPSQGTFTFIGNPFFGQNPIRVPGGVFNQAATVSFTAPTAAAVYEVVNSDPSAIENANIAVGVAFTSNTANNLPAVGQVTANASFAPLSTVGTADASAPIPRFCDKSQAQNTFLIGQCVCNLLFPFVTQAPGFDTGIAIANTSLDNINGVITQTGTVRMDFYGTTTGGAAVSPASLQSQTTTAPVPPGQVLTFTLFGGAGANAAGLQAVPGFTGYIVARANFQYCHGFAFISDLGAQKLAEGYLAIQLDTPQWSECAAEFGGNCTRTGIIGENQGH